MLPPGLTPEIRHNYELLADDHLTKAISDLAISPNFARDARVRLSVAGAQTKAAVRVTPQGVYKPLGGSPSTHLLKIGSERYPDLAKNEAFCLTLARRLGLEVADCELRETGERSFLLIQRYDRTDDGNIVLETHQEDFCQALGFMPADKYEVDEATGSKVGPGLTDCFGVLRKTRRPAIDIERMLRVVVFNFLIGNADAHAKNFSLLYSEGVTPILAPAYDLVCSSLYPDLTTSFAMRHGSAVLPNQMDKAAWDNVAAAAGVRARYFRDVAADQAGRILGEARSLMASSFNFHPPYAHILSIIGERVELMSEALGLGIKVDTPPVNLRAPGWKNLS